VVPPSGAALVSAEETTQEADGVPIGGSPASYNREESLDAEVTEVLPRADYGGTAPPEAAFNETIRELDEQLAAATARTRELRDRLELAEATEAALRESLERERKKVDKESLLSERQRRAAAGQPEKEPAGERDEGFWRSLFG
jgi:TolA-binding protein